MWLYKNEELHSNAPFIALNVFFNVKKVGLQITHNETPHDLGHILLFTVGKPTKKIGLCSLFPSSTMVVVRGYGNGLLVNRIRQIQVLNTISTGVTSFHQLSANKSQRSQSV